MSDDLFPICGVAEAAAVLDVENTRIARYKREGRMPPVVCELDATDVWSLESLELMKANDDRYPEGAPRPPRRKLFGVAEAARNYGKSKRAIARWRDDGIFPEPAQVLARTPVWTADQIRGFRPPSTRRPRSAA